MRPSCENSTSGHRQTALPGPSAVTPPISVILHRRREKPSVPILLHSLLSLTAAESIGVPNQIIGDDSTTKTCED
ncbi:hypothetical protein F2Q69_00053542 [Brassica cretica]|uniref:Uncharacterized protein n=1 Tax=Brassica cretica TaxID=69181 RepID=A0A8S9MSE3_BRACR|nr:hypothetical protein F2Q69_00053542 [Brassica cretica]